MIYTVAAEQFQVFLQHDRTFTLNGLRADDDVAALAVAVEVKLGVPRAHAYLCFAGKKLVSGNTLSSLGLAAGATVHLLARGRGGGCGASKPEVVEFEQARVRASQTMADLER